MKSRTKRSCKEHIRDRREFDTNVLGPILAIQEALKHFPASGGSIITIGSKHRREEL